MNQSSMHFFLSLSHNNIIIRIILAQVHAEYDANGLSACEEEQIARQLFYPKSGYEMHVSNELMSKLCN